jgi:hypothetical protein
VSDTLSKALWRHFVGAWTDSHSAGHLPCPQPHGHGQRGADHRGARRQQSQASQSQPLLPWAGLECTAASGSGVHYQPPRVRTLKVLGLTGELPSLLLSPNAPPPPPSFADDNDDDDAAAKAAAKATTAAAAGAQARGESKRLVVESPWSQFSSECQRF